MGHRNITISDEAYEILAKLKRDKESFTDVIKRVFKEQGKKPLAQFSCSWQGDPEELDAIMATIKAQWLQYDRKGQEQWSA